ncbi:hypothetical protein BT96DRAFT_68154 [Gymnopus androsaceus JB14]|uniref:Uncharacterized protein n=1 Tax=Gymnopus androsaceus JB14 TaxID=1447944 RepID=A0A6A4HGC9_9AGAR|nr:hypothetical protein BT96DRAFT_68154 [Gymnopus androsaceus JB14]
MNVSRSNCRPEPLVRCNSRSFGRNLLLESNVRRNAVDNVSVIAGDNAKELEMEATEAMDATDDAAWRALEGCEPGVPLVISTILNTFSVAETCCSRHLSWISSTPTSNRDSSSSGNFDRIKNCSTSSSDVHRFSYPPSLSLTCIFSMVSTGRVNLVSRSFGTSLDRSPFLSLPIKIRRRRSVERVTGGPDE